MMVSFLNLLTSCNNSNIAVCETYQEQFTIEDETLNHTSVLKDFAHVEGVNYCIHQCDNIYQDTCVAVHLDVDKNT